MATTRKASVNGQENGTKIKQEAKPRGRPRKHPESDRKASETKTDQLEAAAATTEDLQPPAIATTQELVTAIQPIREENAMDLLQERLCKILTEHHGVQSEIAFGLAANMTFLFAVLTGEFAPVVTNFNVLVLEIQATEMDPGGFRASIVYHDFGAPNGFEVLVRGDTADLPIAAIHTSKRRVDAELEHVMKSQTSVLEKFVVANLNS